MPYAVLEQKLRQVPERDFDFVSRFLDFVLSGAAEPQVAADEPEERKPFRQPGILKGQIWMADDFDETPECFKEYM